MDMKVRELRALVTLAEELHFGRAAERLGIAQPQLSEMIRRIENEARLPIFTRRPQVVVTHGGEVLVETARRVLAELEAGTQQARAVAAGRTGRVSLGFSPVAMCSDLPEVLRSFAEANPEIEINLVEGTTEPLRRSLDQGEVDLIIARESAPDSGISVIRFARDHINIILPEGHPATVNDPVPPEQLAGEAFTMFPRALAPQYRDRIVRWAADAGLAPRFDREVGSWMANVALVSAGLSLAFGTALLSRIGVPGVVYRNLKGEPLDVSFWMSWRPERLSPAAQRFVEHVRATRPE
jgi:DNA-binding transcriptional LysR family regulator